MAKGDSTKALRRQWTLVRRLPRYPAKKSAADLTEVLANEGFKVEKRTVERDLHDLAEIFPIECDDREKPFGWSWAKDATGFHLPAMLPSEALALQMVDRFIKPLLPDSIRDSLQPYIAAASKTLKDFSASPASSWMNKVRIVHPSQLLMPPHINPAVHRAVTEGLLLDRQMEIAYRKRGQVQTVTHIVNPLALVQRGPVTYFVVSQSKDPFYLAMHRISKAGILEERAQRPVDFDLGQHIASGRMGFGEGRNVRLQAVFRSDVAEHLHESVLSPDQKLVALDEGRTKITATVPSNQQLEWWLLAFGDQVEVLAPRSLRERFKFRAMEMARRYEKDPPGAT